MKRRGLRWLDQHISSLHDIILVQSGSNQTFPAIHAIAALAIGLLCAFDNINPTTEFQEFADLLVDLVRGIWDDATLFTGLSGDTVSQFLGVLRGLQDSLDDHMIAFQFSTVTSENPNWFGHCIQFPSLVNDVQDWQREVEDMRLGWATTETIRLLDSYGSGSDSRSRVYGRRLSLDDVPDLTRELERLDPFPVAGGGFADIWTGRWTSEKRGEVKVAIKVLRSHSRNQLDRSKLYKRLLRELSVWAGLDHPHIVAFYGTADGWGPPGAVGMVSAWQPGGSLTTFLTERRESLKVHERFRLLLEIAIGLQHLHSMDIVHADLTGTNVLIDSAGKALLTDFGLSAVIVEQHSDPIYQSSSISGAVRWNAPELYRVSSAEGDDEDGVPKATKASDVYSFGSLMLQTLTSQIPYSYLPTDGQVFFELYHNAHPRRPFEEWVSDSRWALLLYCWSLDPSKRPRIEELRDLMCREFLKPYRGLVEGVLGVA